MSNITEHEGRKYLKVIVDPTDGRVSHVDVYCVLEAFGVTCPASAHAIKKLLMPGQRGKGDQLADLVGAQAAINRAVDLEQARIGLAKLRREAMERHKAEQEAAAKAVEGTEAPVEGKPPLMMTPTGKETVETIPIGEIMEQSKKIEEATTEKLDKLAPTQVNREHNQCNACIKQKVSPPACMGHPGDVSCPSFFSKLDDIKKDAE